MFFIYYFQIVLRSGHDTLSVVLFGHTSINVATSMEHILYTLFHSSRELWAVSLKYLLKSLCHAGPRGRSLDYCLDSSLSKLLSQIISLVAHLKYRENNSNGLLSYYSVSNVLMHVKLLVKGKCLDADSSY